jgi:hypothetical protein
MIWRDNITHWGAKDLWTGWFTSEGESPDWTQVLQRKQLALFGDREFSRVQIRRGRGDAGLALKLDMVDEGRG